MAPPAPHTRPSSLQSALRAGRGRLPSPDPRPRLTRPQGPP
jgi:hypothetical protein